MGSWKDKKRKVWKFSFDYLGRSHGGPGFKTRREAEAAEVAKRKELTAITRRISQGMDFETAASVYLSYAERRFAKATYQYKRLVYKDFLKMVGNLKMDEITPQHVDTYLQTMPTNNNYNVRRKELSALFHHATNIMHLPIQNPCKLLAKLPHTSARKIIPTKDEIQRIIEVADTRTDEHDLFIVVLHTLGRIDEVLRIKWEDVDFAKSVVVLWTRKRKGGNYEADDMPMNDALRSVLQRMWDQRKQDTWVFYNEKKKTRYMHRPKFMDALCKKAGCPPIGTRIVCMTPQNLQAFKKKNLRLPNAKEMNKTIPRYYGFHNLRHFMATHLISSGESMHVVQGSLRHKHLSTTEIYIHDIPQAQRSAMIKMGGIFTPKNVNPLPASPPQNNQEGGCNE